MYGFQIVGGVNLAFNALNGGLESYNRKLWMKTIFCGTPKEDGPLPGRIHQLPIPPSSTSIDTTAGVRC